MYFSIPIETEILLYNSPEVSEQKKTEIRNQLIQGAENLMKKEYESRNILFSIQTKDAWLKPFRTVEISDTQTDNVSFIDHRKNTTAQRTVSGETIECVVDLIRKMGERFKEENYYIEASNYLDGTLNYIYLSDREDCYYMVTENLKYHTPEKSPNVTVLISLLNDIFSFLKPLHVDQKFFRLQLTASDYCVVSKS